MSPTDAATASAAIARGLAKTLGDCVIEALLAPGAALSDGPGGVTLGRDALLAALRQRARSLAEAGAGRGRRVALQHGRGAGFLIDLLALWQLGAVAVCLSPSLTPGERERVAATLAPVLWVADKGPGGLPLLPPADPAGLAGADDPGGALPTLDLDSVAAILATSGTTATPKGVVHTHRSLRARLALNVAAIGPADLAVGLTLLPMHFGHGLIGNSLTVLAGGGRLVAWPEPGLDGYARLGATIAAEGITFMSSVPALWQVVLRTAKPPRPGILRRVHVGSAPLGAGLWQQIIDWSGTARVVNMYGITETANWIGGHSAEESPPEDGLVGRPWGGALALRDAVGRLTREGRGEVLAATPALMQGYLDQPALTAAVLEGGWFATGDIGEFDAAGRLRLVGRLKHEINRAGIKVPAEEIDLLLERHPQVAEACAFGLPDPVFGEVVAAAFVARDAALDPAELKRWCEGRIRREALPARLFRLDSLPRNERGKLVRAAVRARCLGESAS